MFSYISLLLCEKLQAKEDENKHLQATVHHLRHSLAELGSKARLQRSIDTLKWTEVEKLAHTSAAVDSSRRDD